MDDGGRGLPDKRRAILAGALAVFARDGYTRASIDAIAAEARVSTRTIYNHFADKAHLFHAVMLASTCRVAEAQLALLDRHLGRATGGTVTGRTVTDLETDLVAFGLAWLAPMPDFADHSALVQQVHAESAHIPAAAVEAWQEAGPLRVRRALGRRFAELADQGLLRVADPERAALHFSALIAGLAPAWCGPRTAPDDLGATVAAGVHAFLYGYGARSAE
jgi:AcrR family transcriptional regulator